MIEEWECSDSIFRIPASHRHCGLHNFTFKNKAVRETLEWFGEGLHAGTAPHLLLLGDQGNGKSHLSVALYRHAVFHYGTQDCWWGDIPTFCTEVKNGFESGLSNELLTDAKEAKRLVVMDDIWGRPLTPWELDNVFFAVLNAAVSNRAALVATTNYTKEQISNALAPHEQDRLLQNSRVVTFKGPSFRLYGR